MKTDLPKSIQFFQKASQHTTNKLEYYKQTIDTYLNIPFHDGVIYFINKIPTQHLSDSLLKILFSSYIHQHQFDNAYDLINSIISPETTRDLISLLTNSLIDTNNHSKLLEYNFNKHLKQVEDTILFNSKNSTGTSVLNLNCAWYIHQFMYKKSALLMYEKAIVFNRDGNIDGYCKSLLVVINTLEILDKNERFLTSFGKIVSITDIKLDYLLGIAKLKFIECDFCTCYSVITPEFCIKMYLDLNLIDDAFTYCFEFNIEVDDCFKHLGMKYGLDDWYF